MYTFGDITDPITGKKVVVGKYRYIIFIYLFTLCFLFLHNILTFMFSDEIEARNELFGKNSSGFDYSRYLIFFYSMLDSYYIYTQYIGPQTEDGKLEREISQTKKLTKDIICLTMMNHMLFSRYNLCALFGLETAFQVD